MSKRKKFTKSDAVKNIAKKVKLDSVAEKKEIKEIIDYFLQELKTALKEDKIIEIRKFGTFEIRIRKNKESRNPKTGKVIKTDTHGVVRFRSGKDLKKVAWSIKRDEE